MGSKNYTGQGRRSNVKHFPQNVVSSPLTPPLSFTTDDSSSYGLEIISSNSPSAGTKSILVEDSSGNQLWGIPEAGGPFSVGYDIQVYHSTSGSCMALRGAESPPCFVFPDNSKMWMGSASPIIGTTVGLTPMAGDKYLCRSSGFLVASSFSTTNTGIHIGTNTPPNSTAIVGGNPASGDLLLVLSAGTNSSAPTLSIGSDSAIPNDVTSSNGTQKVWLYSRVVQAGDISSNVIAVTSSTLAGTGRIMGAMLFRHPSGWATTGTKHQAILAASVATSGSLSSLTLTPTGSITAPAVAAAICFQSTAATSPGMLFQWGSGMGNNQWGNSQYADLPTIGTNTNQVSMSCKPGTGNNISGQTILPNGSVALVASGLGGNQAAAMGVYQVNGSSNPILYVYTGSTWMQVI